MQSSEQGGQRRAIVIEDHEAHAVLARHLLRQVGFDDLHAYATIREGLVESRRLLDWAQPQCPTLILLDWHLPAPASASLEATGLAAELTRAMDEEEIHPALLVGLTYQPGSEREQDALESGCALLLAKPLDLEKARRLRALVDQPVAFPLSTLQRLAYQRILRHTRSTLEFLMVQPEPQSATPWDARAVKWLLKAMITQDLPEPWRGWVQAHGGLDAVRRHVRQLPLGERELVQLRDLLSSQRDEPWQSYAKALAMGKTVFFELRRRLFDILAEALNRWPD
jgi:CheY-like chemotaxis protein